MNVPKILIGPLFNPHVLGDYRHHSQIKIFTSRPAAAQYEHLYTFLYDLQEITHFNDLLAYLPVDWQPDIVIWWDLIYQALPPGVADCPYPTAVIVGDWNLNLMACWPYLQAFDWVFTEKKLCQYLQQAGFHHGEYWPGFSFDKELYPQPVYPPAKRYDVTFIGNLNPYIHTHRNHYLHRLQQLSPQWRICIAHGIHGAAYRQLLAQSRVVFNHSVRGEMNMRAYEAPAAGALLMLEDTNPEISGILPPGKSCLLYNQDNFEVQLQHILSNPQRCEQMAQQGQQAIQAHDYTAQFGHLLVLLARKLAHNSPCQRWRSVATVEQVLSTTRQLFFASTPGAATYGLQYLQTCLTQPELQNLKHNAALVNASACLMAILGQRHASHDPAQSRLYWQQAMQWWQELWQQWPHPLLAFNMGWAWQQQKQWAQSIAYYEQALALLAVSAPASLHSLASFTLPMLDRATDEPFPLAWEACQLSYMTGDAQAYHASCLRLLNWHGCSQLGWLYSQQQRWSEAIQGYRQALAHYPDFGDTQWHLAKILIAQGHEQEGWALFQQLLQRQPFFVSLLDDMLTPHLIWHQREPLAAILARYLQTVHSEDPAILKNLAHLHELHQLVQLFIQLADPARGTTLPQLHQLLVAYSCPLRLAPLLAHGLSYSPHTQLISRPLAFTWETPLPEPSPVEAGDAHFYLSPPQADKPHLTIQYGPNPRHYQRQYNLDLASSPHVLSLHELPLAFPTPSSLAFALPDWDPHGWTFLMLAESLQSPLAQQLILAMAHLPLPPQLQPQILIWNPLGCPQHLDWLEKHWPEESAWNCLVLDEWLKPVEQADLLQHSQVLVPTQAQWQVYYWYWGLLLGTPLWLSPEWTLNTYGGITPADLHPFVHPLPGLGDYLTDYPRYQATAFACQQSLSHFNATLAPELRWQKLWQLKLATLLTGGYLPDT